DPDAVRNFGGDGAADRAVRADVLAHFDLGAWRSRRTGFGLFHGAEREAAERGETARGETRAAKECAAVETAIRLSGESGGEVAAACFAFRSFDQHGRLPLLLRIAVGAIKRLDVIGLPITRLLLVGVGFGCRGRRRERNGGGCRKTRAGADGAKKFTTSERRFIFVFHRLVLP